MSVRRDLEQLFVKTRNPVTLLNLTKEAQKEVIGKLKIAPDANNFRFYQGQLAVLDEYIELLEKAIS